jgi:hypothetical protein
MKSFTRGGLPKEGRPEKDPLNLIRIIAVQATMPA